MRAAVRDRVQKQKADGKTLPEVVNGPNRPPIRLRVWGNGFIKPDFFVTLVYSNSMSGRARSMSSTFVIFNQQKLSSVLSGCVTRWFNRNRYAPTNGIEHTA